MATIATWYCCEGCGHRDDHYYEEMESRHPRTVYIDGRNAVGRAVQLSFCEDCEHRWDRALFSVLSSGNNRGEEWHFWRRVVGIARAKYDRLHQEIEIVSP